MFDLFTGSGGFSGSSGASSGDASTGGVQFGPVNTGRQGVPPWVWLAAAGVAAVWLLRRK